MRRRCFLGGRSELRSRNKRRDRGVVTPKNGACCPLKLGPCLALMSIFLAFATPLPCNHIPTVLTLASRQTDRPAAGLGAVLPLFHRVRSEYVELRSCTYYFLRGSRVVNFSNQGLVSKLPFLLFFLCYCCYYVSTSAGPCGMHHWG